MRVIDSSPSPFRGKPEYLIVEVKGDQMPALLVCLIYRAPKLQLLGDFWESLNRSLPFYPLTVVMGDLNINLLNPLTPESRHLLQSAGHLNLKVLTFGATHHTSSSHSWIDHFLISQHSTIKSSSQYPTSVSGHDLMVIDLNIPNPRSMPRSFVFRDLTNMDRTAFLSDLATADWSSLFLSDSLDYKVDYLNNLILNALDKHAPMKRIIARKPAAPWITKEVKELMLLRDRARDKSRRGTNLIRREEFVSLRNKVKSILFSEKSRYFLNVFKSCNDSGKTWKLVKSLGVGKADSNNQGLAVDIGELNTYLGSIGQSRIPKGARVCHQHISANISETPSSSQVVLDIPVITRKDVHKCIGYSRSSSTGPDKFSRRIIEIALPSIIIILLHLFNFSLNMAVFPTTWSSSYIRPIPKIPNPKTVSDYRPIALTCFLSKLLEKIMSIHMINFLESNNKLNPFQSSYRKFLSTQTALLRVHNDILWAADQKMLTLMVLFDYTKAFDAIEHDLLLAKLKGMGFSERLCGWIRSYLSNRRQCVLGNDGDKSDWVEVSRGVPQGTILGPLFFICFSSDLPSVVSHAKYMVYADDFEIYIHCLKNDLPKAISNINQDISKICDWSVSNYLHLNQLKTKTIIFGSPPLIKSLDVDSLPKVRVGDVELEFASTVKNLGVWFDQDLSWTRQLNSITSKIHFSLRQLRSSFHCFPLHLRIDLIRSLIFPHLDYCCLLLLGCPEYVDLRLKRLINLCIRFVFNLQGPESITPRYIELNWLLPNYRRLLFLGIATYKLLKHTTPRYLADDLIFKSVNSIRPSRGSALDLFVPFAKTEFGLGSFKVTASNFWNSIPECIRNCDSKEVFSKKLKTFLLDKQAKVIKSRYT